MNVKNDLTNPLFVTIYNDTLMHHKDRDIAYILNNYIIGNKMVFDPLRHNPYQVIETIGFYEKFLGPVAVDQPEYIKYVNSLRHAINILADMIKTVNIVITECKYNEWWELGTLPSHNIHKAIVAARHNLVDEYKALIQLRRYWKSMYKAIREANIVEKVAN